MMVARKMGLFGMMGMSVVCEVLAAGDVRLQEFTRTADEVDDSPRIQRAIDAASPYGVVDIPMGVYEIAVPLSVTNRASIRMHKSAILRAVRKMDFVLRVDNASQWGAAPGANADVLLKTAPEAVEDYNFFIVGGQIDGNALASCMSLESYHHYTLRDVTFLNGLKFGLRMDAVSKGYELVASDCYFKTVKTGCKGNAAVYLTGSDSHFTDCIVVDYTIGFFINGGSNRLTRCHVWGGPVIEMLEGSVNFHILGDSNILRDCYADTGKTGFLVGGTGQRLLGCSYFANPAFGLDDITIFRQTGGEMLVADGCFHKTAKNVRVYEGTGRVKWRDNLYTGFGNEGNLPGVIQ